LQTTIIYKCKEKHIKYNKKDLGLLEKVWKQVKPI